MLDTPKIGDLIAVVRKALEADLTDHGEVSRLIGLRAAKVLQILEREITFTSRIQNDRWARLLGFQFGTQPLQPSAPDLSMAIEFDTRRLAEQIRSGRFDEPRPVRDQLIQHLKQSARETLQVNDPEFLERVESE